MKKNLFFLSILLLSIFASQTILKAEDKKIDTNNNDKINSNITDDKKTDSGFDWGKMENMTPEERKKYLEEQKKGSTTSISEETKEK